MRYSRAPLLSLFAALATTVGACDTNDGEGFNVNAYLGSYRGSVSGSTASGGTAAQPFTGTGTATLAKTGEGTLSLQIASDDPANAAATQVFAGTYTDDGMRFTLSGFEVFAVDRSGRVTGDVHATQGGFTVRAGGTGTLTPARFTLDYDLSVQSLLGPVTTADIAFDGTK